MLTMVALVLGVRTFGGDVLPATGRRALPARGGLLLVPGSIVTMVAGVGAARLARYAQFRVLVPTGLLLAASGYVVIGRGRGGRGGRGGGAGRRRGHGGRRAAQALTEPGTSGSGGRRSDLTNAAFRMKGEGPRVDDYRPFGGTTGWTGCAGWLMGCVLMGCVLMPPSASFSWTSSEIWSARRCWRTRMSTSIETP